MAYIYKITNLINSKIYIGQTIRSINVRWNQHKSESFNNHGHGYNYHLHNAIRKYGSDNFKIEIIEQCPDEERFEEETYYIKKYNSTDPKIGYNFVIQGTGKTQYATEDILELWNQGLIVNQIAEKLGCHKNVITNRLHANNISHEDIMKRFGEYVKKRNGKIVEQYDLTGRFIGQWPSTEQCEKGGFAQSAVCSVCNQKQKSAYNFLWKYKDDPRPISEWIEKVNNKKSAGKPKKPVIQYSLSTHEEIQRFPSAAEAARFLHLNDKSVICRAARVKGKSHGYYWEYEKE